MSPDVREILTNLPLKDILRAMPRLPNENRNRLGISDRRLHEQTAKSKIDLRYREEHFSTQNLGVDPNYDGLMERPRHDFDENLSQSALSKVRLNSGLAYESGSYRKNSQLSQDSNPRLNSVACSSQRVPSEAILPALCGEQRRAGERTGSGSGGHKNNNNYNAGPAARRPSKTRSRVTVASRKKPARFSDIVIL